MRLQRLLGVFAVFLVACSGGMWGSLARADSEQQCMTDSQCGFGSCQFGTCSPIPPDTTSSNSCSFDSDCPGGSCQFGSCSSIPATSGCAVDAQCPGGSCQFGR